MSVERGLTLVTGGPNRSRQVSQTEGFTTRDKVYGVHLWLVLPVTEMDEPRDPDISFRLSIPYLLPWYTMHNDPLYESRRVCSWIGRTHTPHTPRFEGPLPYDSDKVSRGPGDRIPRNSVGLRSRAYLGRQRLTHGGGREGGANEEWNLRRERKKDQRKTKMTCDGGSTRRL